MDDHNTKSPDRCIERTNGGGSFYYYSVDEYAAAMKKGLGLGYRAREFWELVWTETAPAIGDLIMKWSSGYDRARITDPAVFNAQLLLYEVTASSYSSF